MGSYFLQPEEYDCSKPVKSELHPFSLNEQGRDPYKSDMSLYNPRIVPQK